MVDSARSVHKIGMLISSADNPCQHLTYLGGLQPLQEAEKQLLGQEFVLCVPPSDIFVPCNPPNLLSCCFLLGDSLPRFCANQKCPFRELWPHMGMHECLVFKGVQKANKELFAMANIMSKGQEMGKRKYLWTSQCSVLFSFLFSCCVPLLKLCCWL